MAREYIVQGSKRKPEETRICDPSIDNILALSIVGEICLKSGQCFMHYTWK